MGIQISFGCHSLVGSCLLAVAAVECIVWDIGFGTEVQAVLGSIVADTAVAADLAVVELTQRIHSDNTVVAEVDAEQTASKDVDCKFGTACLLPSHDQQLAWECEQGNVVHDGNKTLKVYFDQRFVELEFEAVPSAENRLEFLEFEFRFATI
jgi:hypothetical protein